MEKWIDCIEFSGYQVSNVGRVRSIDRKVKRSDGIIQKYKGKILKQRIRTDGYPVVTLSLNGGRKHISVHRLMMLSFCPTGNQSKMDVNHKNGIKVDNTLRNLEWMTRKQNIRHAFKNKINENKGEKHYMAKLNQKKVDEIRELYSSGSHSYSSLAKKYNVHTMTVAAIITKRTWRTK